MVTLLTRDTIKNRTAATGLSVTGFFSLVASIVSIHHEEIASSQDLFGMSPLLVALVLMPVGMFSLLYVFSSNSSWNQAQEDQLFQVTHDLQVERQHTDTLETEINTLRLALSTGPQSLETV